MRLARTLLGVIKVFEKAAMLLQLNKEIAVPTGSLVEVLGAVEYFAWMPVHLVQVCLLSVEVQSPSF